MLDKHLGFVGFVINFGVPSLKDGVERVVNNIQKDFADESELSVSYKYIEELKRIEGLDVDFTLIFRG